MTLPSNSVKCEKERRARRCEKHQFSLVASQSVSPYVMSDRFSLLIWHTLWCKLFFFVFFGAGVGSAGWPLMPSASLNWTTSQWMSTRVPWSFQAVSLASRWCPTVLPLPVYLCLRENTHTRSLATSEQHMSMAWGIFVKWNETSQYKCQMSHMHFSVRVKRCMHVQFARL